MMSTTIETNTEGLQEILQTINNLPNAGDVGGGNGGDATALLDARLDGSITSVDSNVTKIGMYALARCESLLAINFPLLTTGNTYAFQYCISLISANTPLLAMVQNGMFEGCSKLTTLTLPSATTISSQGIGRCSLLTTIDLPMANTIYTQALYNDYSLTALILRRASVCTLANANALQNCYHILGTTNETYNPNGLKDGYIYVPASLLDSYKAATNWSTYATQFRALETYTVDGTITGDLDPDKI